MAQKLSINIPSRSGSPSPPTDGSHSQKSELQLQFEDAINRVTTDGASSREDYDDDDDDACSSYDGDNELPEVTDDAGQTIYSPGPYAEFASQNPYADVAGNQDSGSQWGNMLVCQTLIVPVRFESHEEALSRLSSQLESVHNVIRAEESAALQFLKGLSLDGGDSESDED
ncbi:hypothetical protein F5X99DRAFT_427868 [Biscogniauxia marginata]|nr:hypothetical protein F5X99DRAFT_427868 [Biscogniauxia marginata]